MNAKPQKLGKPAKNANNSINEIYFLKTNIKCYQFCKTDNSVDQIYKNTEQKSVQTD